MPEPAFEVSPPSVRDMLLGSGPRFARDAFGPALAFYVGWKSSGLVAGIGLSTLASFLAFRVERRAGRPGFMARMSLFIVVSQALIGLAAGSERVYLAQPVLVNALYGVAFVVSVAVRRPLAGAFADDFYPFPAEVRASTTFRRTFARISLTWGVFLLARAALRLATLSSASIEGYLAVNVLTGAPPTALLMSWSVWYAVRSFRRSEEWGPAIRALEELGVDLTEVRGVAPRTAPSS